MLNNIPTPEDYYVSGKELLDFAWDIVASLLYNLDEAEYFGIDSEDISESYWYFSRTKLTTALSITQQGIEFILKGKISEVSPFLLIFDPPQKWPSPYEDGGINFSAFRSIDAQDLIRVHDTFSVHLLPKNFVERFHELREQRNRIMHSVDRNIVIHATDVMETLLFMHKSLFPEESWASIRLSFLRNSPSSELGANEYLINQVCKELLLVIGLLSPSKVKEFFSIDKKQRKYFCPKCFDEANTDVEFESKLAELRPKGPRSKTLYCPVCNDVYPVVREDCQNDECPGNVLSDDGVCLTCCG